MSILNRLQTGPPEDKNNTKPVSKGKKLVFDGVLMPSMTHPKILQRPATRTDETVILKTAGQFTDMKQSDENQSTAGKSSEDKSIVEKRVRFELVI